MSDRLYLVSRHPRHKKVTEEVTSRIRVTQQRHMSISGHGYTSPCENKLQLSFGVTKLKQTVQGASGRFTSKLKYNVTIYAK